MRFVLPLTLLLLGACTLPLQSRQGLSGTPLEAAGRIAIVEPGEEASAGEKEAAQAVAAELRRQGFVIAADAPVAMEVAFSIRPAATSLLADDQSRLSDARNRHRLKLCEGHIHRLALAVHAPGAASQPSRGWAEQYRCSDRPAASLAKLAPLAVATLAD